MAASLEIDAVVAPAVSRAWLSRELEYCSGPRGEARGFVDAW